MATVTTRTPGAVLAAALLGFVVISLDALVVNVALPDIGSDLVGRARRPVRRHVWED